jgi:hypothetical protein
MDPVMSIIAGLLPDSLEGLLKPGRYKDGSDRVEKIEAPAC